MKLKYLGTGASEGFPGVFCQCDACKRARGLGGKNLRRRSSAVLDGRILVDIPPDLYGSSLLQGVDLSQVPNIVVTHVHEDHFYLHELSNFTEPFAHRIDGPVVRFHGSVTVRDAFDAKYGDELDGLVQMVTLDAFVPTRVGGHTVTALPASHGAGVSFIYLFESEGKRLLYANDTGLPSEVVWQYLQGKRLDLVSMDCTSIIGESYATHMTISDNLKLRQRLRDMGSADDATVFVATHFSHNGILMHEEIEARFAGTGVCVAYDGFEVDV